MPNSEFTSQAINFNFYTDSKLRLLADSSFKIKNNVKNNPYKSTDTICLMMQYYSIATIECNISWNALFVGSS